MSSGIVTPFSMKSLLFSLALLPALAAGAPVLVSEPLVMDNEALTMTGSLSGRLMPRSGLDLPLQPTRPAGVKKEPAYRGTPLYATLRFGNGPRADTIVVVDRAPDERREENRMYVDLNQNGDLTDDGDGRMQSVGKSLPGSRVGPHFAVARASWGAEGRETATGEYGFMCLIGSDRGSEQATMMLRTAAVRVGTIAIDGTARRVALMETRCDGLFDVAQAVPATSVNFAVRGVKTMTLLLDANGDGEFGAIEVFDACLPVKVGATTYEASSSVDGTRLTLTPTDKPAQVVKVPVRAAATKDNTLLRAGALAPDFTVDRFGGGTLKLSELRGKTVVLDFWATWCIPCIRSMPHVQKTIAKAKGGEIVWLGVCVWDDRPAFDRWVPANDTKYNFTKVFDPAAKDKAASIAGKLYQVTGIPTLYVIDREGRIVEGMMGYLGDDDDRLAAALAKAAR
jgi:thiol-disulfide isomerase/thioredoxin